MKFLQGKPLHIRKRIAAMWTGGIAIVLILLMVYSYSHPQQVTRDPERGIMNGYTIVLGKIQSLFHRK